MSATDLRIVPLLAAATMVAGAATATWGDVPAAGDFARAMELKIPAGEGAATFILPAEVYRTARRPDLGDLRVFDAGGNAVPAQLVVPAPPPPAPAVAVPLFRLPGVAASAEDLSLRVATGTNGSVVSIDTRRAGAGGADASFILDATAVDRPVSALELSWEGSAGWIGRGEIAASNDLRTWSPVASQAPLALLRQGGERLERRSVEFAPVRARYLRLTLQPAPGAPSVTGATLRPAAEREGLPREWIGVVGTPVRDRPGEYRFDTGGMMPVDRLRLSNPPENTLVRLALFSRQQEDQPWRCRGSALLYRIGTGGTELASPPAEFAAAPDRQWLVKVEGGGFGGGQPVLEFGWLPHQLLFLAEGDAPFILAYGSARPDLAPPDAPLLAALGSRMATLPAATAGPERPAAGDKALRPRLSGAAKKRIALWTILVLAVALPAWMAAGLVRELRRPPQRETDTAETSAEKREEDPRKKEEA